MAGVKHLIQCHCILPQYRNMSNPMFHKFTVYSKYTSIGDIEDKIAKCNNCGIFHKVYEICKSELLQDYDGISFLITVEEIEDLLPDNISRILRKNNCDLATWENVLDVYRSKEWGVPVVIARNTIKNISYVKSLTMLDKDTIDIKSNTIDNILEI